MPKLSGESMRTIHKAPKAAPSRPILHGFGTPVGPKVLPNAQGASKRYDNLKTSPGKIDPRQQRY
jgi:hypothetical protein